jgi:O-antigen/teichoic acid export membrane protein
MRRKFGCGNHAPRQSMMRLNADLRGLVHLGRISGGYIFTTLIDNAIPFLMLPVLTRYLSPTEYANIALFGFYLAISNSLSGISIHTVIYKNFFEKSKEHIARIIGSSILIVSIFSLTTMLIILFVYLLFGNVLELPLFWLVIIPLVSISSIIFNMGLDVLQNKKQVLSFSFHRISNTMMNALMSLILVVVLLRGWQGRVWGIIFGFAISAAWSFCYLKKNGYISFTVSRDMTRSILKVVLPLIPNSFQSLVVSQVGIYFIQYYFTKKMLGVYSVGFQIAYALQLLIGTLGLSWSPFLYQQLARDKGMNKLYITRLFYGIFGIVFLGLIFINVLSGWILRIMATPAFYGANEFIPWFTLGLFFHGICTFLSPILIKHDKQKYISKVSFINMVLIIGLNIGLIKLFGYIGVVYAYCLIAFIKFMAFAWKSQKVLPLPWMKAMKILSWQ